MCTWSVAIFSRRNQWQKIRFVQCLGYRWSFTLHYFFKTLFRSTCANNAFLTYDSFHLYVDICFFLAMRQVSSILLELSAVLALVKADEGKLLLSVGLKYLNFHSDGYIWTWLDPFIWGLPLYYWLQASVFKHSVGQWKVVVSKVVSVFLPFIIILMNFLWFYHRKR